MPDLDKMHERLRNLWNRWDLDVNAESTAMYRRALEITATWLDRGARDPATVLEGAQILQIDPENPGARTRGAVERLARELGTVWAGIERKLPWMQALVLASWPDSGAGAFALLPLMAPALAEQGYRGRLMQKKDVLEWWTGATQAGLEGPGGMNLAGVPESMEVAISAGPIVWFDLVAKVSICKHSIHSEKGQENSNQGVFSNVRDAIASVNAILDGLASHMGFQIPAHSTRQPDMTRLTQAVNNSWKFSDYADALLNMLTWQTSVIGTIWLTSNIRPAVNPRLASDLEFLSARRATPNVPFHQVADALIGILDWIDAHLQFLVFQQPILLSAWAAQRSLIQERWTRSAAQQELLFWGQARYCHGLGKPYRRMKSNPDQILFWAAFEAAQRAACLPGCESLVEPVTAYLCEVLHQLGLPTDDPQQARSLHAWLTGLQAVLSDAPKLSGQLGALLQRDALGLPVSWLRAQGAAADMTQAMARTGLDLDLKLDLGQWASWIFRECLLDLRLAQEPWS